MSGSLQNLVLRPLFGAGITGVIATLFGLHPIRVAWLALVSFVILNRMYARGVETDSD